MAGIAQGDGTWFQYITETTIGTSPITGIMYPTAIVSEGLKYNRSKTPSSSITSTRQVDSLIRQTSNVTGSSAHEMRYGEFDDFFESVFDNTWSTDVLIVGDTAKAFSIERGFPNITTPAYELFSGCQSDGFNMSVPADTRKVDLTFNWFGRSEVVPVPTSDWVTTNVGVTLGANPAAGKAPMYLQCGEFKQDGVAIATVTSLNLTFTKGLKSIDTVDCDDPYAVVPGQLFTITGDMGMVFENMDTHNDFLQDTEFAFDLQFTDGTSTYLIEMDAVEFSDSENPISGPNEVTRNQSFIAKYDSGLTSSVRLTRTA